VTDLHKTLHKILVDLKSQPLILLLFLQRHDTSA
jgi:hypothetical protein